MSKAFKSVKKILKPIASVALPIAASFIPGIGPLGMALAGAVGGGISGGGKGALLGGLTAGLGGGLLGSAPQSTGFGLFDSLNSSLYSGLSPLRGIVDSAVSGIGSGIKSAFGPLGSSTSAATNAAAPIQGLGQIASKDLAPLAAEVANSAASESASSGMLGSVIDKIKNASMSDVAGAAALISALNPQQPEGTLSQRDIVARMDADRAKTDANNAAFIASLNSSPIQQNQTNPQIDYYNYGSRPEALFFEDPAGGKAKFAEGGSVEDGMGGQDDTVDALLSVGEYVIPADVVSSLGDGNTDAGASKLDMMVEQIRKQKSSKMGKGKLPAKAKSPLAYMGVA